MKKVVINEIENFNIKAWCGLVNILLQSEQDAVIVNSNIINGIKKTDCCNIGRNQYIIEFYLYDGGELSYLAEDINNLHIVRKDGELI